jgi:3'(2'), 5'-bisphosphate nucleotidase
MMINAQAPVSVSAASLARMVQIARAAGRRVMESYGSSLAATKGDQSPLTAADLASQQVIMHALVDWDAGIPIVSEESEIPDYEERKRWVRFWLVDPLDGTQEFLQRNGEFTVNIALIDHGEPVLGVVHAPALAVTYAAGLGLGSWRYTEGAAAERLVSDRSRRPDLLRIVESRSHPSTELERYLQTLPVAERLQVGSSLKFCHLAEGRADVYPRMSPIMEWDVAAGDCVFRNSAGVGSRPSPLRYNSPDMRIPSFVLGL